MSKPALRTTRLSEFIRNASPEEKERVYLSVIDKAIKAQSLALQPNTP